LVVIRNDFTILQDRFDGFEGAGQTVLGVNSQSPIKAILNPMVRSS